MKSLPEFLNEGVYDPAIFKAFVLAGGPASGKSFVVGKTTGGLGLKVINSDTLFELFMRKNKLDFKMPPDEEKMRDMLRDRAKQLTDRQMEQYINGRLGLIVDGTGRDYDRIKTIHEELSRIGYDVYMIFVNTSLETALERNRKRSRTVPDEVVKHSWDVVQNNMGKFQRLFGSSNFIIIDNNDATEDVFMNIWKRIRRLIKKPPKNSIAKKWIAQELELKHQG